jgi:hypothetical protein
MLVTLAIAAMMAVFAMLARPVIVCGVTTVCPGRDAAALTMIVQRGSQRVGEEIIRQNQPGQSFARTQHDDRSMRLPDQ